jgi:hypothetical protein
VIAGLDTLLIALYADLNDRIIPTLSPSRAVPAPSRPAEVTNAELVCPARGAGSAAYDDERHWLHTAPARAGPRSRGCAKASTTTGSRALRRQ